MKKLSFVILAIVCLTFFAPMSGVFALAEGNLEFDKTDALEDLLSDETFTLLDYPFTLESDIKMIKFFEYCYSYDADNQANYALYVYIYNPKNLEIETESLSNKIQMAVGYNEAGMAIDYEKFILKFCTRSESDDYYNLFYKFKVLNSKALLSNLNSNGRRYDVSGIELVTAGDSTAVEYGVSSSYVFSGYAAGYGPNPNAVSTLSCAVKELDTIELEVNNTYFRTGVSSAGAGHQNELNSVFFAVPDKYITTYGNLQKIKAEWYEYKTNPIVVTNDIEMYNKIEDYIGVNLGSPDSGVGYSMGSNVNPAIGIADWGWNTVTAVTPTYLLPYLFYTNFENVSDFDVKGRIDVNADRLSQYILSYNKSAVNGYLPIKNRDISSDLFMSSVDPGRTRGYNCIDKSADELFNMLSYDHTHSWWDSFLDFGFFKPDVGGDYYNKEPIYIVTDNDMLGSNSEIAERLLINEKDINWFKSYYVQEKIKGNHIILFRFALTDYYTSDVVVNKKLAIGSKNIYDTTYIAQETVFFDFDLIQLTFLNSNGNYTILPVVSNPLDIINDITNPLPDNWPDWLTGSSWLRALLMIVMLIVLLVILMPLLPYLFNLLIWLLRLPFRLIGGLFKGIKKAANKAKERRY